MTKSRVITWICVSISLIFYTAYMIFINADRIRHVYHTIGGQSPPCIDLLRYEKMRTELIEICHRLNKANVSYWVDDGTLLGLIREDGVMKHDFDVDVAYMHTDLDTVKQFVQDPYHFGRYTDLYRYELYHDTYMIRKCESQSWYYKLNVIKNIARFAPATWYLPTQQLGGDSDYSHCRVPVHSHKILKSKYGEEYLNPVSCDEAKEFIPPTEKEDEPAFC